jgi:hypothetical protein
MSTVAVLAGISYTESKSVLSNFWYHIHGQGKEIINSLYVID